MKKETIGDVPGSVLGMIADLTHKLQHGVITPAQFARFLKKENPFSTPASVEEWVADWRDFYRAAFGLECGFSGVAIPERREGFDRLIIVAGGMTAERVYQKCKQEFPCWKYTDRSLDDAVPANERDPKNGAYAIWVRDVVEADEEHASKSAIEIEKQRMTTETLLERLLHELKFYRETGKHLDINTWTLCSDSRGSDGGVPNVVWSGGKLEVDWCLPDDASGGLRAREVCS